MTKKDYCTDRPTIAYYSGLGGLEVKHLEYGIDDHVYLIAGAWNGKKSYHRLKIIYGAKSVYIRLYGHRCPLSEFIRA